MKAITHFCSLFKRFELRQITRNYKTSILSEFNNEIKVINTKDIFPRGFFFTKFFNFFLFYI